MNPQSNQTPGLHLPQPSTGVHQATPLPSLPSGIGAAPAAFGAAPMPQVQAAPLRVEPTDGPSADGDAADVEWVEKAREVVGRTRVDPFEQSKELGRLKAQYIKTRYNKDIKVSEERS